MPSGCVLDRRSAWSCFRDHDQRLHDRWCRHDCADDILSFPINKGFIRIESLKDSLLINVWALTMLQLQSKERTGGRCIHLGLVYIVAQDQKTEHVYRLIMLLGGTTRKGINGRTTKKISPIEQNNFGNERWSILNDGQRLQMDSSGMRPFFVAQQTHIFLNFLAELRLAENS